MKKIKLLLAAIFFYGTTHFSFAQTKLHVNDKWDECSFQLDPSLTQKAWHEFTQEAALVAYFRPLTEAKPLGVMNFEISILQWQTSFNDRKAAWNDTFVHPDSTHWLKERSRLSFPGLTARVGVTEKMDVALYITKSPGANYGFFGGQVQYNLSNETDKKFSTAGRISYMRLYGPDDFNFSIYGLDFLVSKEFKIYSTWVAVVPYVGLSTYLSNARETTERVNLENENVVGAQAMAGAVLKISKARLGFEYSQGKLNTISAKIGVCF